jgi:hypothetical protein
MTDRPPAPGRRLDELLAGLPEDRRLALINHASDGLSNATHAVGSIVGGARRREDTVTLVLASLGEAIRELEAARAIVAAAAEGGRVDG